jgi:hypothetical protein
MISRSSVVALAAVAAAACGGSKVDRLDLRTPGSHPGVVPSATLPPPPTATPTPKATPTPVPKAVKITHDEKRVIKGWSDALRHGHVAAAARYFSVPSVVVNGVQAFLTSRSAVRHFNAGLACGAKLLGLRRGKGHAVLGTFRLTERPGGDCGTDVGSLAGMAFLVRRHLIIEWARDDDQIDPAIAGSGTSTPTPTPTTP